jgi:hypothetical protein
MISVVSNSKIVFAAFIAKQFITHFFKRLPTASVQSSIDNA